MKSDLNKTLRKIIREEVEQVIRKEFVEFVSLIGEANNPKKKVIKSKPKKKVVSETSIKKLVEDIIPKNAQQVQNETRYAKDPILNSILNETQGGLPSDGSSVPQPQPQEGHEEYPTMGGKTFDKSRMAEMLGYGGEVPMTTPDGRQLNPSEVPEPVQKAMTRDYGDLMKAIDKKKVGSPLKG